jgi:hypothetical protein
MQPSHVTGNYRRRLETRRFCTHHSTQHTKPAGLLSILYHYNQAGYPALGGRPAAKKMLMLSGYAAES